MLATMDPVGDGQTLDAAEARQVLRLAMHMGDTLLAAGMSANDVVVLMLRIGEAYRLRRVHIDVNYTSITATYYPAPDGTPVTAMRVVESGVVDYTLVQALNRLAGRIGRGLPIAEAIRAYEQLRDAPRPYPEWVATAASAGVAAAASLMLASSWKIPPITFVTGLIVARVLALLGNRRLPALFQQMAAAALVTLVAAAMSTAAAHGVQFFVGVNPTSVVVGGIIMLVAGMMFVGAAQDAIDEFYVTASARVFEVAMRTAGIVFGIVLTLYVTRRLGIPVAVFPEPVVLGPLVAQYVGATLACVMFALSCYAPWKTVALSAAMGLLGWTGYTLAFQAGGGEALSNTVGALAVALVSTLLIRRTSVPGFALISAALIPLVPGLMLYTALFQMVGATGNADNLMQGALTLFEAVSTGLGIAVGASLGTYLGRPMADQLHRIRDRARELARPERR